MMRVILAIVFFLIITPAAVWRRLAGGDSMPLSSDQRKSSYWEPIPADPVMSAWPGALTAAGGLRQNVAELWRFLSLRRTRWLFPFMFVFLLLSDARELPERTAHDL